MTIIHSKYRSCYACGKTKDHKDTWTKPCFYLNHDTDDTCLCGKCYMHIVSCGGRHINDKRRGRPIPWIETKKGPESRLWKGGRTIDFHGYVLLHIRDHPRAHSGYVKEHILVMEKHLGRYLARDELVHHINNNKKDNRIENLQLMTPRQHMSHHKKGRIPWNKGLKLHQHAH